jgi:hypothetical protein
VVDRFKHWPHSGHITLMRGERSRLADFASERLLIYLAPLPHAMRAASGLGAWVAAGLAERDGRGMNRLRLVVVLDDPSPEAVALIESAFRELPDLDDRVHLHVLATAALAGI